MSHVRPIEDLFADLLELKSLAEREAYLTGICGEDPAMREQLQKLLAANEKAGSFLASFGEVDPTVDVDGKDWSGQQIGPYTLREQIGDGGMGIVYVAERRKPYRQKVALKLIKPGMDSKAVLARFDAERQALALMEHPNIAKVLDAGTTDQGRPYFVMELIQGEPITDYCDEKKLTINQRLELFATVCQAVQHAHQKGVIHRDIKPNNVLVTEIDGKAVPKVIDFGVAKALSTSLTARTVYTSFQALVGTPLYMSPEQARLSGVDVDTRSDVYSLGVLLYELLTGDVPFDRERMKRAALDELCRIIRDEDPPSLSVRISKLGDTASQVSQNRGTETNRLIKSVKNELTWIVSKAMDKERNRRYQSPSALAEDIHAHLSDAPISAGKPSHVARARRYAKRHWKVLAVASAFLLIATYSTLQALHNGQLLNQYRVALIDHAIDSACSGDFPQTEKILKQINEIGGESGIDQTLLAVADIYSGKMIDARERLARIVDNNPGDVAGVAMLSVAEHLLENYPKADEHRARALSLPPRGRYKKFDEMCLAHARLYDLNLDPDIRIRQLRELTASNQTPMIAVLLATVLAEKTHHSWDGELVNSDELATEVREAEELVEAVRRTSPDFYFLNYTDLFVTATRMKIMKESADGRWRDAEARGRELANDMLAVHQTPVGLKLASVFFLLCDDSQNLRIAYEHLAEQGIRYPLYCHCLTNGKSVEAVRISQSTYQDDIVTYAALSGVELSTELLRKLRERSEADLVYVLLARHRYTDAQTAARAAFESSENSRSRGSGSATSGELELLFNNFIDYVANDRDDEWLLDRTPKGEGWSNLTRFLVGICQRAKGNTTIAAEHFRAMGTVQSAWNIEGHWKPLLVNSTASDESPGE